jgi:hypothetical protein
MRPGILLLALLLAPLAGTAADAPAAGFVRVWPRWRDGDSFKRISEYFTGMENDAGTIVLRSRPENREGYYFLARLAPASAAPAGSRFVLDVITPDQPNAKTHTFPENPAGGEVYLLGLTGADWKGEKARPVAWRLELLSADGRVLAAAQSFLWSKPD